MIISDIISLDRIQCSVGCQSKKKIFETISELAVKQLPELDQVDVLCSLLAREKKGSTGIGNGIAIPHGRIKDLTNMIAIIITSEKPIEFDAIDQQPVDIFFAILVPEEKTHQHLEALSGIARKLSDQNIVNLIRTAGSKQEIITALA